MTESVAKVRDWHDALPWARKIYARHAAGCCLHCVLDDGNCEDSSVASALDFAREKNCMDCQEGARVLSAMSVTQRKKLYAHYAEYGYGWLSKQ